MGRADALPIIRQKNVKKIKNSVTTVLSTIMNPAKNRKKRKNSSFWQG
jgi:hypothetical protein